MEPLGLRSIPRDSATAVVISPYLHQKVADAKLLPDSYPQHSEILQLKAYIKSREESWFSSLRPSHT
jgi:hypothetical protein